MLLYFSIYVLFMPRKGYGCITLNDDLIGEIDSKKSDKLKTRPSVIDAALKKLDTPLPPISDGN